MKYTFTTEQGVHGLRIDIFDEGGVLVESLWASQEATDDDVRARFDAWVAARG